MIALTVVSSWNLQDRFFYTKNIPNKNTNRKLMQYIICRARVLRIFFFTKSHKYGTDLYARKTLKICIFFKMYLYIYIHLKLKKKKMNFPDIITETRNVIIMNLNIWNLMI